jgi:hypothetical protein
MAPSRGAPLAARQFAALLRKNLTLTVRSRRSPLGVGGWGGLLLQICLPALFFGLMWIPKHYIKPIHHPAFLPGESYDIDTKWWAGPSPYEGGRRPPLRLRRPRAAACTITHTRQSDVAWAKL